MLLQTSGLYITIESDGEWEVQRLFREISTGFDRLGDGIGVPGFAALFLIFSHLACCAGVI